jgi:hypothetical protein
MTGTLNGLAGTKNLGMLAAANAYAGTKNLGLIAALNAEAGNGTNPKNWLDFAAVCNQLAGTTNLEALQALQILLAAGGGGGGGGTEDMALIQDILLAAPAASFSFTAIPATYKALYLVADLRSDYNGGVGDSVNVYLNADVGANYESQYLTNYDGTAGAAADGSTPGRAYVPCVGGGVATISGAIELWIPNYAGATFWKNILIKAAYLDPSNHAAQNEAHTVWKSAAAVTGVSLTPLNGSHWVTGSRASLYGLV